LAATGAFAQSSVQIDGVMDAGFQSINYKGANNTVNGIAGNGSSTSQINFRGTEDLGGGLKANFRVETDWNVVSNLGNQGVASGINTGTTTGAYAATTTQSINSVNSTFGNGEIRVGLAGGFGSIDAGAVNYNTLGTYLTGQPFGTAIGSGFRTMYINDAQATSQVRAENSVKYVTPTFSGFNASLYKSNKQTKAGTVAAASTSTTGLVSQANAFSTSLGAYDQVGTQELGVNYANGPLAASFSNLKQNFVGVASPNASAGVAGSTESTVNTLGANYAFGDAKLFGLYQTNKTNTNSVNNKTFSISGTYTMGAVVLMAQAGQLKNVAGLKSKLFALGADYNLSKRTAVYFRAESIDDKANAMNAAVNPAQITGVASTAGLADQKFGRTAIGIRHAF
jgi:predicted porin